MIGLQKTHLLLQQPNITGISEHKKAPVDTGALFTPYEKYTHSKGK